MFVGWVDSIEFAAGTESLGFDIGWGCDATDAWPTAAVVGRGAATDSVTAGCRSDDAGGVGDTDVSAVDNPVVSVTSVCMKGITIFADK